jgi:LmbE family N-acetylglucosaminyl deacetylase
MSTQFVQNLGSILGVFAHPDDEAFACSGVIMQAIENGQKVVLVTATRGCGGQTADESRWPQKELTAIRTSEMSDCLKIMGRPQHHWLDMRDGSLDTVDQQTAVDMILEKIDGFTPDTVITFEEQGITGHNDHRAVHRWAKQLATEHKAQLLAAVECDEAYEQIGRILHKTHNIYFNTKRPRTVSRSEADFCFSLTETLKRRKTAAIKAHQSQTSVLLSGEDGQTYLDHISSCECYEIL